MKLNFYSSFRTLHDPLKDDHEKNFILNKWKEGRAHKSIDFYDEKSFRMVAFTSRIKTSVSCEEQVRESQTQSLEKERVDRSEKEENDI